MATKEMVDFNKKMGIKCACSAITGQECILHGSNEVLNWETPGSMHQLLVRFTGKDSKDPIQMVYTRKDKRLRTFYLDIPKHKLNQFLRAIYV